MITDDLIARLEAASKGNRELDIAIFAKAAPGTHSVMLVPPYTISLDAALTLWGTPDLDRGYPRRGINLFYAVLPGGKMAWNATAWELKDGNSVILHIATRHHRVRAISACLAALEAREA
jgi:hypothetical protein